MKISVCIPTVRSTTLGAAIASIRRQTWTNWELIIVGQGRDSTMRTVAEAAADGDDRVRYIHLAELGVSRARNAGFAVATGDVIACTDDDCEAHPDWLQTLAECFTADPEVGVVGGALLAPERLKSRIANCPSVEPAEALYDPAASGHQAPPGWDWVSANFAIRRDIADRVGPFDEYLGPGTPFPGCEDTDYKLRLERMGIKMRSTPRAIVYHTYGARYGVRAVLRHSRNYARGNGAMAGKLTLLGDPRGPEWLAMTLREFTPTALRSRRERRLPENPLRLWHFRRAYYECLRRYRIDQRRGVLYPVQSG